MKIDQTRYKAFWTNPERYRLCYELNIVPATLPYGLQRGIAFHTIANLVAKHTPDEEIMKVLNGVKPDPDGQMLKLSSNAIHSAIDLWNAIEETYGPFQPLESEKEFEVSIFGTDHSIVGRIDHIFKYQDRLWILEFKTGSAKTSIYRKTEEWKADVQADFEIIGANSLGYEVEGVLVFYAIEADADRGKLQPTCPTPIEVRRSNNQLRRTLASVEDTCNIIEELRRSPGINNPWPHLSNFPCSGDCSWCGYENICGTANVTLASLGDGWEARTEHLKIIRQETGSRQNFEQELANEIGKLQRRTGAKVFLYNSPKPCYVIFKEEASNYTKTHDEMARDMELLRRYERDREDEAVGER